VAGGADDLLYVRRSDDTEFRPIPGSERGRNPSISPDGQWVVFRQGPGLVKTQLAGGPILPVAEPGYNPHWFSQEEILYAGPGGAYTVNAAGGSGTQILEGNVNRPFMLPGGRGLLYGSGQGVVLADLTSGDTTLIAPGGSNARYVPTGHILYGDRDLQAVFALPFDIESLTVTGEAAPVLPSVNIFGGGAVQLAVSDNGTLVHGLAVAEGRVAGEERMTWFAADGTRTDLLQVFGRGQVGYPRISPDGTRVAYGDDDADEVFAYDLTTGERAQITQGLDAARPVWSPDGSQLYMLARGPFRWLRAAADGSGTPELVHDSVTGSIIDVSGDGAWGVVEEVVGGEGAPNLLLARLDDDPITVQPYLRADWHEEEGVISPDGRWLAYVSSQGGEHGIYIRSFPEPGPAVQISSEYGDGPVWAPDGEAVYFVRRGQLVRRAVSLGETVRLGEETELFSVAGTLTSNSGRMYDIHPDGDRFLFVTSDLPSGAGVASAYEGIGPVVVVVNWFEELRERVGESR
jgi:serine/threonine-protein kinase